MSPWLKVCREELVHYGITYMDRYVLRTPLGELRLHWIGAPDGVREHLHDHPWWFVSMLLWGSYAHIVQRRPPGRAPGLVRHLRRWVPFSVLFMRATDSHVITDVSAGGAWTLVLCGPRVARELHQPTDPAPTTPTRATGQPRRRMVAWGFWVDGLWKSAAAYFSQHRDREDFQARETTYIQIPRQR